MSTTEKPSIVEFVLFYWKFKLQNLIICCLCVLLGTIALYNTPKRTSSQIFMDVSVGIPTYENHQLLSLFKKTYFDVTNYETFKKKRGIQLEKNEIFPIITINKRQYLLPTKKQLVNYNNLGNKAAEIIIFSNDHNTIFQVYDYLQFINKQTHQIFLKELKFKAKEIEKLSEKLLPNVKMEVPILELADVNLTIQNLLENNIYIDIRSPTQPKEHRIRMVVGMILSLIIGIILTCLATVIRAYYARVK